MKISSCSGPEAVRENRNDCWSATLIVSNVAYLHSAVLLPGAFVQEVEMMLFNTKILCSVLAGFLHPHGLNGNLEKWCGSCSLMDPEITRRPVSAYTCMF